MQLELFHYVHCPYCVRVRMALGYLGLNWKSTVVSYDDESTPVALTGVKMLPIMKINGKAMNESLQIICKLDAENKLQNEIWGNSDEFLNEIGNLIHNLCMPYWIWTPEFTLSSRNYFVQKKSQKRGPFHLLAQQRYDFEQKLMPILEDLTNQLKPFWNSDKLTIKDIGLASHLWGLFVVPEFRFPQELHQYLITVKHLCRFDYHQDFWR